MFIYNCVDIANSISETISATESVTHSLSANSMTATVMMTSDPAPATSNSMIYSSPTLGINFMTSSSIYVMVTTSPIDARQEQNDDGGSNVDGIVAGCVVAFVLIIVIVVCLIIFLMWYRAKKKGECATKRGICVIYSYHIAK